MLRNRLVIIFCLLAAAVSAAEQSDGRRAIADGIYIKGIVRDSVTATPLARASVMALPGGRAVVADENGLFGIAAAPTDTAIRLSAMGYDNLTINLRDIRYNLIDAYLTPATTELDELTVRKSRYSKKNNPAVELVRQLRRNADLTDPERNDYYTYDKYERITLALNDYDGNANNLLNRRFSFIKDYIDTSEVSGKPIVNISVKEKTSTYNYRRSPRTCRTTVTGFKSTGIDAVTNSDNTQIYLEDVLREIDIYDRDINLLQQRFVSPLSPLGPDFYKYYITDTVLVDGDSCRVLSFYPFNRSAFGFTGHLYIAGKDSTLAVRKVVMSVPRESNINFVEEFYLTQLYDLAADGSRLKKRDDLTLELAPLPGMPSLYVRRNTSYNNHSFDLPADSMVFTSRPVTMQTDSAEQRTTEFWEQARLRPLSRQESRVGEMLGRFGESKLFYYGSRVVAAFVQGYIPIGDKFDFGPVNTTVSFNPIEGTRLRLGGLTTANLSRRWFARGFAAYGTKDHRWKYNAEVEYSFHDKKRHSREFPVHSLRLAQLYDINYVGQHYLFTNSDNVFLSLKRMTDYNVIYNRITSLTYTLELYNNFSIIAQLTNDRRQATEWIPFVDGNGNRMNHYTENSLQLTLRYAPGEKFFQTRSSRFPVNLDAPIFILRHTFAPSGLGSKYLINKTEFSVQKRIWFSWAGYLDGIIGAARVWSRSPWLDLIIPNANLSYTIQPESFALLNPMEFINDSQLSWFMTYSPNGLFFNMIPGLKKTGLRETFSFSGFYGRLSDRNTPSLNPSLLSYPPLARISRMSDGPYMEAAVGISNIFRCLRVDYVWRLSYRHPGYHIDRSGIRIAFQATF